jgi:hypothetical protein
VDTIGGLMNTERGMRQDWQVCAQINATISLILMFSSNLNVAHCCI